MNRKKFIPLLAAVLMLTACAVTEQAETETVTVTSSVTEVVTAAAETMPSAIVINEDAGLEEQVADALHFMAATADNMYYDFFSGQMMLIDVKGFDGVPELILCDTSGKAADFFYVYGLDGRELSRYVFPSIGTTMECVEKDGRKYLKLSGNVLDDRANNGEEGPLEYRFTVFADYEKGEEYSYSSRIVYGDESLESIISAEISINGDKINDTPDTEKVRRYYDEFTEGYINAELVSGVYLDLYRADFNSRTELIERITPQVRKYEAMMGE